VESRVNQQGPPCKAKVPLKMLVNFLFFFK